MMSLMSSPHSISTPTQCLLRDDAVMEQDANDSEIPMAELNNGVEMLVLENASKLSEADAVSQEKLADVDKFDEKVSE